MKRITLVCVLVASMIFAVPTWAAKPKMPSYPRIQATAKPKMPAYPRWQHSNSAKIISVKLAPFDYQGEKIWTVLYHGGGIDDSYSSNGCRIKAEAQKEAENAHPEIWYPGRTASVVKCKK